MRKVEHIPVLYGHTLVITFAKINLKIGSRLKLQFVEIETLTAVPVALLTLYDMCKVVDRGMVMDDVRLLMISDGKCGD